MRIENKLNSFSNILHGVTEGDFSQRLRVQNSDIFPSLALTINDLVEQASFHHSIDKSNNLLLQKIVSNIEVAIIISDTDGNITLANQQAVLEFEFPAQAGRC